VPRRNRFLPSPISHRAVQGSSSLVERSGEMPKWSEVPWGTIITGLVALYGAGLSTRVFFAQRARDRLIADEAQRRQADQVTGWLVKYEGPEEPGKRFYGLALQNDSSQPVYDLIANIVVVHGSGDRTAVRTRSLRGGRRPITPSVPCP
jgi:hypothetical protein